MDEPTAVAAALRGHDEVVVVTHGHADLDTLGSAVGLARSLDAATSIVLPDGVQARGARLLDALDVDTLGPDAVDATTTGRVVVVDAPSADRVAPVDVGPAPVVVDHHEPGDLAERATAAYVDTDAGATAALVAQVLDALDRRPPPDAAVALAAGLLDDTGSLTDARPAEFQIAGRLFEAAGERVDVLPALLDREPSFGERVAATKAVVRADGYRADRTLVLLTEVSGEQTAAAHALRGAGADVALVVSDRDERTWVVGRARAGGVELPDLFAPLAERFGGESGGHAGAAVAKLDCDDPATVRTAVLAALEERVGDLSPLA
ncbi:DHH family phosphoesterase [Halorarius litoreus]|uniref:DHH family phosphoesterase n=1 Tax=Halorarius litoreus TaxID=2962676 RepID=UPI0020CCEAA9|nr:DHH family phosphoesterase [Halorarius litoreus]